MITWHQRVLRTMLGAWSSAQFTPPATGTMKLFTGNPVITNQNVEADFTEATFPGYASQTWTFGSDFMQPDEETAAMNSTVCNFTGGAIVTPETITGFWLLDGVGNYIGADFLRDANGDPAPVVMANNGQILPVMIQATNRNRNV